MAGCKRTKGGKITTGKDLEETVSTPAGTQLWRIGSKLASGGDLGEMSKYDPATSKFSHTVNIEHQNAFTLTPLLVTEGPLNGRHVLVLDSVKTFCFLELPAEIRVMIYRYLIEEPEPIKIRTFTLRANGHRAVRAGFEDRKNYTAHGLKFNQRPRKYIGQPASYFALAAVNKQMPQKHVPLCMATMSSTSRLSASSTTSRGRPTFDKLVPATSLRDLSISHHGINLFPGDQAHLRAGGATTKKFIEDARPFLRELNKAVAVRNIVEATSTEVMDIINAVAGNMCRFCSSQGCLQFCTQTGTRKHGCKGLDVEASVSKVNAELRTAIAKELRVTL